MTPRPTPEQLDLIAGYLDGSLDGAQRAAFEEALASDPTLQAEVKFRRRLDDSLTRLFDHDAAPAPLQFTPAASVPQHSRRRLFTWIAAAAALLLAASASYYFLNPTDPNLISPDQVYAKMQAVKFVPQWKCKDNQEFIDTVQKKLGEGLLIPSDTPGLEVAGWAYSGAYFKYPISADTMILITKKDNDNILLLVDRAGSDRKLKVSKASGLHLFRDTAGGLVLYEITPRTEPVVIPVAKANKPNACPPNGKP